ncbi:MAG: UDP-N-acetylmuramoyl-L-alanyl-D-glutamate--2,6-diaminopimelate ligase, partial [Paracoccaceae bacterium]|nr:UDP-N-acetylmuramoyl-L-alanyl-D-glutamate--2,6-diaminopimelate ligase [Paracoccaceae bacterium]
FAALPGTQTHGAEFIPEALELGAKSILTDAKGAALATELLAANAQTGAMICLWISEDPRQTLAAVAALWFAHQPRTMIAVTGTNGKTSVASFVRQIWAEMGLSAINLGTNGVEGVWQAPLNHTTPEPITLHRVLAQAQSAGVTHAAMEASSHGLEQCRLDGTVLSAAGFTNFTQDHLDYHTSFEAYFVAKSGLFSRVLSDQGCGVLNLDDPKSEELCALLKARGLSVIGVGRDEAADLHLTAQRFDPAGQTLLFSWQGRSYQAQLTLIGGFQADNVLLAAGLVIASGGDPNNVFETLPALTTVRGRMERVAQRDNGAEVFVDYAHTPHAIATALQALRPHVLGRLVVIIGAGGDRDCSKRMLMGQAAADHADQVIVTDDNPRSEDPASIRALVLQGAPGAHEVPDRAVAIVRGVDSLGLGDALLIAGKGHETTQTVGDAVFPFDDAEHASIAVAALEGRLP